MKAVQLNNSPGPKVVETCFPREIVLVFRILRDYEKNKIKIEENCRGENGI